MTVALNARSEGTPQQYLDEKKWKYLLTHLVTAVPMLSVFLYFSDVGIWATLIPGAVFFVAIPALDYFVGEDTDNLPESAVRSVTDDPVYSILVRSAVPLAWLSFFAAAFLVGTQPLPLWSFLVFTISVGTIMGGGALTIGHELGHKLHKVDKMFALLSNGLVGYAHFRIEHNRGHHVWVATPEDPASSKMNESIYRFAMREIRGGISRGWSDEAQRLKRNGKSFFSLDNEILQGLALTLGVAVMLVVLFGWKIVPFIALHHAIGWYALTQANYVEHYGLLRQKKPNGRYESVKPHHSWNANHTVSNLMTFQLQRHSDHHANPLRPYQALRNFPDLPTLPTGYSGMFVLAAFPPLFFRIMNPKVMEWADGDLSRVNAI
jgi:alkane 1-monooxygenase